MTTGAAGTRRNPADVPSLAEQAYRRIHRMIGALRAGAVRRGHPGRAGRLDRARPQPGAGGAGPADGRGPDDQRPRFGYQVAPITLADIREIFGLREIVEPAAAELACQLASDADLDQLDALCVAPDPAEDVETIMARNRDFHLLIGKLSGNRRLADVIERLVWESDRFLFYQAQSGYPVQQVPTGHQRLVQVMRTRDPASARLLADSDARSAAANLIELIVSAHDPRPWPVSG